GFIGAVWAASSAIGTLIKGFNRIYEVDESRPIWVRYGLAVGLTLFGGAAMLAAIVLLIAGQTYGTELAAEVGLEGTAATVLNIARWPIIAALLVLATAVLYWAAPNVSLPFRWISPGAAIFVVSWIVATFLFGLYVSNFG